MQYLLFSLALIILQGCAQQPNVSQLQAFADTPQHNYQQLQQQLRHHYSDWQGTPYQYGGLSKHGIDCSGFVYLTFRNQLGITLPRTGAAQSRMGQSVSKKQLQPGDLVFFKTAEKQRHAGIYIGQQQFIHASSSNGVTLSSLKNPYWRQHYWMGRRI
jgi:cell wall-associated NlpC family hydrolase|tara:strand:- start:1045 stop:1518 length:474 start_codon:yes stop_codon:yes gene_type:complete